MDEKCYQDNKDRMIINFRDLFYYLLSKWKTLLIAIVIGVGVGVLAGYCNDIFAYKPTKSEVTRMDQIYQYEKLYEYQVNENKEALFMQISNDSTCAYGELVCYVNAGKDTPILEHLLDITQKEDFVEKIRAITGYTGADRYLRETVSYVFENAGDYSTYSNGLNIDVKVKEDEQDSYAIITYQVRYLPQDQCKEILNYIEVELDSLNKSYKQKYEGYKFEKLTQNVVDDGDAGAIEAQRDALDDTIENLDKMKEQMDEFTSKQLAYYNRVYLGKTEGILQNLKWYIIGIVVCCFIWFGVYMCKYFFSDKIWIEEIVSEKYGLYILAKMKKNALNVNGIDRWIANKKTAGVSEKGTGQYTSDMLNMLEEDFVLVRFKSEMENYHLDLLNDKGVVVDKFSLSAEAIRTAKKVKNVLFLIELGEVREKELNNEMRICKYNGFNILGAIVVEK